MNKRLIVVSLDAVGSPDMEFMKTLPNFKYLMDKSFFCENVYSVYPSLTYPAHTSIVTGKYPKEHGIVNNMKIQRSLDKCDWFWERSAIKCTTVYDEAIKKGMKVASLFWPVTGKANIQYNLPEVIPNRPWDNQLTVMIKQGTPSYLLRLLKFAKGVKGAKQPELDNFVHKCLKFTIDEYLPDLTLIHYTDVDVTRHLNGVFNGEVEKALKRHDERLGDIIELADKMPGETNIIVLGDHFHKDASKPIYINKIFKKHGLIEGEGNKVTSFKAICREANGSANIFINNGYGYLKQEIYDILKERLGKGIEKIYSHEEAVKKGADPRCMFMVEAMDGYYFGNEMVVDKKARDHAETYKSTHGYDPEKSGYQTFFMASGSDINVMQYENRMELLDEAAIMARILDVDLGEIDGKIPMGMFKA